MEHIKGRWAWIDTDNDGMAEAFTFTPTDMFLEIPPHRMDYQVNRIGAWVVGGEVKQKAGGETKNSTSGNGSSSENQKNSNNSYSNDPEWYLKADGLSEIDASAVSLLRKILYSGRS